MASENNRKTVVIGTIRSALALRMSGSVRSRLEANLGDTDIKIEAAGPEIDDVAGLISILRSTEIGAVLVPGAQLPNPLSDDLEIAVVMKRQNPRDVFLAKSGSGLGDIPEGAGVNFTTLQSQIQVCHARPDFMPIGLQGSPAIHIEQLRMGWCDGLVMPGDEAEALRAGDLVVDHISMSTSLPLPGQGSAVIVARKDDEATLAALQGADDAKSRRCIEAERSIETRFQIAEWLVAVWVRSQTKKISAEAALIAQDGSAIVRDAFSGPHADFESMAQALTDSLSESAS